MSNTNWFRFPSFLNVYPKEIVKLAERAGVTVEEIADAKKVEPGTILDVWISRDEVETLFRLEQHPHESNWTFMYFDSGNVELATENHKRLMRRIDNFLKTEPNYTLHGIDDFPPPTKEEIAEMEGQPDSE